MTRVMRHPYYGDLITCAECLGDQHDEKHGGVNYRRHWYNCDVCGNLLEVCLDCSVVTSCCVGCNNYHAFECPWPL